MSGDQVASSFGDPNAQPPTPKQTPTSTIFPSPVFETPRADKGRFDEPSGWTPRFAEEYSVFNATPGNLRGTAGPFPDFGPASPYIPPAGQKRPLSAGGLAAEIAATHVTHFSHHPSLLPPVEPSRRLPSSPGPLATPTSDRFPVVDQSPGSAHRSVKKARCGSAAQDCQGQTATPPPSAHKGGERKLAPKPDTMQNDQGYGQPDFMGTPQQPGMGHFVTTSSDMFGYPLSAPATAPVFTTQRPFWDLDPGMEGMDIDFSNTNDDVFRTPTASHRHMGAVHWGRTNEMFQDTGAPSGHNQDNTHTSEHGIPDGLPLVSQATMQALDAPSAGHPIFNTTYQAPVDGQFGMAGAVNPGLLYSRPQSSNMDAAPFNNSMQMQNPPTHAAPQESEPSRQGKAPSKAAMRAEIRRSASVKETAPSKRDRHSASSPIKPSSRPGLSRSFSENRGKKTSGRPSLPTLAPGPRPHSQLVNNARVSANRPIVSQPSRPNPERSSPLKSQHQRLPSLSSIPETTGPRARTQAKFTIDANGRARVETTIIVDDEPPPTARKRYSVQPARRQGQWGNSTDEDDSSSTDEEPIIIPSRNSSFVLPDPVKPSTKHPFHSSQRSMSERSTTSYTTFKADSQDDGESDAETFPNDMTPTGKTSGDAASELRKLRESRARQMSSSKQNSFTSSGHGNGGFAGHYPGHGNASPTSETSMPTPSSDSSGRGIRCVCNRQEVSQGDNLLILWYGWSHFLFFPVSCLFANRSAATRVR
ncbi:hypothetical protein B0T19DRAFT_118354 [Cercophora scortea]|uniref:PHD finger domain protein n=1 Tax=Cercophora scortea TaxID=314031 RepID=A0AAE0IXK7_9PEZI|nr:hypothetical protein B0T19DRAFT_118354 [Cercophora scortea]